MSRKRPKRRLLIRPGGIGDCITTFPAMKHLRGAEYTEVWTNAACLPLIDFADRARCAIARGILLVRFDDQRAIRSLRREFGRFDEVVSWYGAFYNGSEMVSLHPHLRLMQGVPGWDCGTHVVDFHLEQVGAALGAIPRVVGPRWRGDGGFVAIQPFASGPHKEWPFERFLRLEALLEREYPTRWIVDPKRLPLPEPPRGEVVPCDLAGAVGELARAKLHIGNDTGISHLAGAVGAPSVVIFRGASSAVWSPRSANRVVTLEGEDLAPEGVVAAARVLLDDYRGCAARKT